MNPFWARWRITDGVASRKVRPAAYKTGTTSDNRDVHAYGYLAPPSDKKLPGLVAGVWIGNSDNSPNDGLLSLDTSGPLWSAILSEVSKGMPIEGFARVRPKGLVTATVDAFTGLRPGAVHHQDGERAVPGGNGAQEVGSLRARGRRRRQQRPALARGMCRADGQQVVRGLQLGGARASRRGRRRTSRGSRRAAKGPGVRGGPRGTRTAYFYGSRAIPVG